MAMQCRLGLIYTVLFQLSSRKSNMDVILVLAYYIRRLILKKKIQTEKKKKNPFKETFRNLSQHKSSSSGLEWLSNFPIAKRDPKAKSGQIPTLQNVDDKISLFLCMNMSC